jgi:hypothetical protein
MIPIPIFQLIISLLPVVEKIIDLMGDDDDMDNDEKRETAVKMTIKECGCSENEARCTVEVAVSEKKRKESDAE